jgi:hypothetical protein
MDLITVMIFIVLCLAAVGAWVSIGFVRYKSYFNAVDRYMAGTFFGRIWVLQPDELSRLDDIIRRCYFQKKPVDEAIKAVLHEVARDDPPFRSHL